MGRSRQIFFLLALAVPLVACAATTQPSTSDELLKSKGLKRIGTMYEMDGDINLAEILRPLRKAKHDVEEAEKKRQDIESEIRSDEKQLENWAAQRDNLGSTLAKTDDKSTRYNELVVQYNSMKDRVSLGAKELERREDDLQKIRVPQKEYLDALAKYLDVFKATSDAYAQLAADPEVSNAIKTASAGSKTPYRLGPSAAFQSETTEFRKLNAESQAGIVKLKVQANTAWVDVTINDMVDVNMVVDSGASNVVLSPAVVDRLGIKLSKSDRIGHATIANGQTVDVHYITVKSIRLGPFTVENVPCSVQPDARRDSACLLGGGFLRNFAYQMDMTNGELHLSQISGRPVESKGIASSGPTSRPLAPAESSAPVANAISKPMTAAVQAALGWTKTEIRLQEGKCYQIAVSGRWTNADGTACGGDGVCPARWSSALGPAADAGRAARPILY